MGLFFGESKLGPFYGDSAKLLPMPIIDLLDLAAILLRSDVFYSGTAADLLFEAIVGSVSLEADI